MASTNLGMKNLHNNVHRNGFDQSYRNLFTAKVGELLPCAVMEMNPGDKINYSPEWFTRTQPLESSAFTRLKEYVDVFFVPYRLLWREFPDVITMAQNKTFASSSNSAVVPPTSMPFLTISDLATALIKFNYKVKGGSTASGGSTILKNEFGFERAPLAAKLFNYLGFGYFPQMHSVESSTDGPHLDFVGYDKNKTAVNIFRLLAYQKIYADYFRNDRWQSIEPWCYNIDYVTTGSNIGSQLINVMKDGIHSVFDLRYCNYNLDYFLGVLPDSQFGEVASISGSSALFDSSLASDDFEPNMDNSYIHLQSTTTDGKNVSIIDGGGATYFRFKDSNNSNYVDVDLSSVNISIPASDLADYLNTLVDGSSGFNVLSLRKAEALQKWREITQSGNKDYKTQISKHFNKEVSSVHANKSMFLDGFSNNLIINDVVNQNLTSDNSAEIYGKCQGAGKGHVSFEAPEHGIFMAIYHCMPLLDWAATGIDRMNMKTSPEDFLVPEMDSIGMQRTFVSELLCENSTNTSILGYSSRYMEYKSNYDRINGEFNFSLKNWTTCFDVDSIKKALYNNSVTYIQRDAIARLLMVNPAICNSIFAVNADASTTTDNLLVGLYNDMKTVRPLDVNGLPY